jgi:putative acetyltransferase
MEDHIVVRKFNPGDTVQIARLLYDTVHTVNANDYSREQLDTWAPQNWDLKNFEERLTKNHAYVAELNGCVVGFGSITNTGFLDLLYTHKDHQNKGIATQILDKLEHEAIVSGMHQISVEASITAAPFFKSKGYGEARKQIKKFKGVDFVNYVMHKDLPGRS